MGGRVSGDDVAFVKGIVGVECGGSGCGCGKTKRASAAGAGANEGIKAVRSRAE